MHKLCIDIGNSSAKIAVFSDREMIHFARLSKVEISDLTPLLTQYEVEKSIISSVREKNETLEEFLVAKTNYTRFSTNLTQGVESRYKSPQTLGLDRWAAVLAVAAIYPNEACLVIDAGTCITYDLLNKSKVYEGGSISPGIAMRFKAMHEFTGKLPLINWSVDEEIPDGVDTESAMKNGVLQGVVNEIKGFIAINNIEEHALKVVLTGGDAKFLYKQLQNSIFAPQIRTDSYLVLKGLNEAIAD
ncbi:type III pantothenate kinase [Pedobacter sp. MW01-1-1]|uniref:type III pantothenate kinase n=1 Tax=Pedobacter sp. MW01-1-1 TaxID=3383027 RepID=UPI003FF117FE